MGQNGPTKPNVHTNLPRSNSAEPSEKRVIETAGKGEIPVPEEASGKGSSQKGPCSRHSRELEVS